MPVDLKHEYPSNLSDEQWRIIRRLLPRPCRRGRKPIDRRRILNAILYWVRTGCQWRYLPECCTNWNTVYGVFRKWRLDGTWQRIHDKLREMVRKRAGNEADSYAGRDRQPVDPQRRRGRQPWIRRRE